MLNNMCYMSSKKLFSMFLPSVNKFFMFLYPKKRKKEKTKGYQRNTYSNSKAHQ